MSFEGDFPSDFCVVFFFVRIFSLHNPQASVLISLSSIIKKKIQFHSVL